MNSKQKASAAARRITTRNSVVTSLQVSLQDLPVTVSSNGFIDLLPEMTDSQFDAIAATFRDLASQSTTAYNFGKGDMWIAARARYGGGKRMIERIYTDPNVVERQCANWANCATTARKVPRQDRDISRLWTYYRDEYGRDDIQRTVTDFSAESKRNVHVEANRDYLTLEWEEISGRSHREQFPMRPVKRAVVDLCIDNQTGELDLGW